MCLNIFRHSIKQVRSLLVFNHLFNVSFYGNRKNCMTKGISLEENQTLINTEYGELRCYFEEIKDDKSRGLR